MQACLDDAVCAEACLEIAGGIASHWTAAEKDAESARRLIYEECTLAKVPYQHWICVTALLWLRHGLPNMAEWKQDPEWEKFVRAGIPGGGSHGPDRPTNPEVRNV